jgi:hypothetical protein
MSSFDEIVKRSMPFLLSVAAASGKNGGTIAPRANNTEACSLAASNLAHRIREDQWPNHCHAVRH